jgi:hypothetical protein
MKHSSRCNDRSSVGAVELFLVNLNDKGISERLESGGWCLFWTLWSFMLLNISLHDSWYFASFFFIKAASIPSPSSIRRISRGIGISLILTNSEIFFDKVLYLSWFCQINFHWSWFECLSSWQIKHFHQSVLCFSWVELSTNIKIKHIHQARYERYIINYICTIHQIPSVINLLQLTKIQTLNNLYNLHPL